MQGAYTGVPEVGSARIGTFAKASHRTRAALCYTRRSSSL